MNDGSNIQYLHASRILISDGDKVGPDTPIGITGKTGANAVHLHVQSKDPSGKPIDPKTLLDKENKAHGKC